MIWALIVGCSAVTLQIPSDNTANILLNEYIVGNNLTYSVSGDYYDASGNVVSWNKPSVSQGMVLEWNASKPLNLTNNFLLDTQNSNISFSLEGKAIVAWNLTQFPVILPIAALDFQQYLCGMFPFVDGNSDTSILLLNYSNLNLTFYVATFTGGTLIRVPSLTWTTTLYQSFTRVDFEKRSYMVYAYVQANDGDSGFVSVFSMPISLLKPIHFVTNITEETIGQSLSPVRYAGLGDIGFLCDYNGIFILSMQDIESKPPILLSIVGNSTGNHVLDCLVNNNLLLLSTTQGILNYTVVNTWNEFSVNATLLSANNPLNITNGNSVIGTLFMQFQQQVVALYEIVATAEGRRTNFKVLNNAAQDLRQTVVVDNTTSNFLIDYQYDAFPAFALVIINQTLYVIFDTYSELKVYRIHRSPTLTFTPGGHGAYTYVGTIETNSAGNYDLNVSALDIHNTNAVYIRDPQPPGEISHYLGVSDSVYTDIYFPVSNYFFGPNLTYSISAYNFTEVNRTVIIPPLLNSNQSFQYSYTSPTSQIKVLNVDGFAFMGLIAYNNSVEVFNSQDGTLASSRLSSVQPSDPTSMLLDFSFIADIDNSASGIILASNNTNGELVFELFNLSSTGEPRLIHTYEAINKALKKLEGYNGVAFAMVPSEILVIEFSLSVPVRLSPIRTINAQTLTSSVGSFTPLDFASSFSAPYILYIYEATHGLVFVDMDIHATTSSFQLQPASYSVSNPASIRLISPDSQSSNWVYVVGGEGEQLVQLTMNYKYDLLVTGYYLSDDYCSYDNPVAVSDYIAVTCASENSTQVYVFDTTTTMPDSLVTAIPVSSSIQIALASLQSMQYRLFTYDGKTVTRFGIGQTAQDWKPFSQLFTTPPGTTIWARVTLTFASQPALEQYLVPVNITATCWMCEARSTNVTYQVVNPGTFIIASNTSSIFSAGQPVDYTTFGDDGVSIPLEQFIGLDITYTLTINSNQMYQIHPLPSCERQTNMVCLTSKYFQMSVQLGVPDSANISTFLVNYGDMLYFAYIDYVYVQEDDSEEGTEHPISEQLGMNVSSCYLLAEIQNCYGCQNIVAAACIGLHNNVSTSVIALLKITEYINVTFQEIDFLAVALSAIQMPDNNEILYFISDGSEMIVYNFTNGNPAGFCTRISSASLKLSWLSPNSMQYLNETSNNFESLFVMGDLNYGTIILRYINELGGQPIFIFETIITPEYGDNAVVAVRVHKNPQEIYILTQSGFFTQYDLETNTNKMTVNPVIIPEFVPLVNVMVIYSDFNYIAYLVVVAGMFNIRVLNILIDEWRSVAYTTINTGINFAPNVQGSIQILSLVGETLQVAVILTGLLQYTVYSVNFQTQIYVIKSQRAAANFTMQLMAGNTISSAQATPFTVYFSTNDTDDNGPIAKLESIKHFYQMWWFWASIGFGLIISFTAVALLMIKYYGRKRPKRSFSVAMTEPLSSIDRFSSLSVS